MLPPSPLHPQIAMAELINALNGGDTTPISHKLECSLIVRESCGAMLGRERFR